MNEKQQYQRILHTGDDDSDDNDANSADGALSLDGAAAAGLHSSSSALKQRRMPKRQGSHGSLASYRSLASAGEDDNIVITTSQSNDTTYEDALEVTDDMLLDNSEIAPFSRSFDQEDQGDERLGHMNMDSSSPPSMILKGSSNHNSNSNNVTTGANNLRSPKQQKNAAYPAFAYSSSFDLDDDDDDDEADLKRYNLDFSTTHMDRQTMMMTSLSQHGPAMTNGANSNGSSSHNPHVPMSPQSGSSSPTISFSWLAYAWYSFQSLRQQARQRRAQRLLQQSERNCRQTIWICVMTYCDATDRGIILVAAIMLAWSLLVYTVSSTTLRRWLVLAGLCMFVLRLVARPLIGYIQQKTSRRRRLKELQKNQQLQQQQQQSPKLHHLPNQLYGNDDEEIGARTPPGRYLDQPPVSSASNNGSTTTSSNSSNDHLHLAFDDAAPHSDNFELRPMRRITNNGNISNNNGRNKDVDGSLLTPDRINTTGSPNSLPPTDPAIHTV